MIQRHRRLTFAQKPRRIATECFRENRGQSPIFRRSCAGLAFQNDLGFFGPVNLRDKKAETMKRRKARR
jgi:hypothetical protein